MSIRNLSASQLAQHVADSGGASVYFRSGKHVKGPGFMVSDYGAEKPSKGPSPSADEISDYIGEHYDRASKDPEAAAGFWGDTMDVSRRVSIGAEARRRGRENLQEAAYALSSTSLGGGQTPESLNREYGADVLLNMGRTPKAEREAPRVFSEKPQGRGSSTVPKRPDEETPIYRDISEQSVQANNTWARSSNPNDFNLNEIDNDAWSLSNRHNQRRTREKSNYAPERKERRRDNLGDVFRTINRGRTMEARGKGLTVHPTKGWHPKDAGPSKVSRDTESYGYADYSSLESERSTQDRAFPYNFAQYPRAKTSDPTPAEYAKQHTDAAADLHVRMVAEHGPDYLKKFRERRGLKT